MLNTQVTLNRRLIYSAKQLNIFNHHEDNARFETVKNESEQMNNCIERDDEAIYELGYN